MNVPLSCTVSNVKNVIELDYTFLKYILLMRIHICSHSECVVIAEMKRNVKDEEQSGLSFLFQISFNPNCSSFFTFRFIQILDLLHIPFYLLQNVKINRC